MTILEHRNGKPEQVLPTPNPPTKYLKIYSQKGAVLGWLLSSGGIVLLAISLLFISLLIFGKTVPPGYMGLRQTYFGPTKGYETDGYGPGLYLTIPFLSTVHLIPEGIRLLHLEGSRALSITTDEGAMVDLNVSIATRINRTSSDKIKGPGTLARNLSIMDSDRWDKHIEGVAEKALLDSFGKLLASDFYLPNRRAEATMEAENNIRAKLAQVGIAVEAVLLHSFNYQRAEIESAIFAKNLQVKEEELNRALSRLAKVEAELTETEAKLKADIDILVTRGEQEAAKIKSEANLIEATSKAKGDELVALSEAKVKSETGKVLANQQTASKLIAESMAPLLASLKGGVISGLDPYNIDEWARKFGVNQTNETSVNQP